MQQGFRTFGKVWKTRQRPLELALLCVVALYTLVGFFLVNAGLGLNSYGRLYLPNWGDWFIVAAAFVAFLFLINLIILPALEFRGDQILLPLVAFLCATGLLTISYLEPTLFRFGVGRFVAVTASTRNVAIQDLQLYRPESYLDRAEFDALNESWIALNAENASIRAANLCDIQDKAIEPLGPCPPVDAPLSWHYYLYDQFSNLMIGFVILLCIVADPQNKRPWFKSPARLFMGVTALLAASMWAGAQQFELIPSSFNLLGLDGRKILFAIVAILSARYFDEAWLRERRVQIGIALLGGVVLLITVITKQLSVPLIHIQVSEILKLLSVALFAGMGSKALIFMQGNSFQRQLRRALGFALVFGITAIVMLRIFDLGAVLILATILSTYLFLLLPTRSVWPLLFLSAILLVALGAVGYYILPQFDVFYVRARIDVWLDPWLDIQTDPKWAPIMAELEQRREALPDEENGNQISINIDGDQIIQTWRALYYGGLTGQGLGQGASYIIPAAHNDMAFAVIIEQMGWMGGLFVLAAYLILILRGFRIAFHNQRRESVLLAAGLTSLLGFQTFIIVAGTFGVLPLTGITVPFISMGGTSILISFIYVGFLLRLSTAQAQLDPAPLPFEVHHLYNSIPHLAALFLIIFPLAAGVGIVRIRNNADRLSTAQAPFNPWIQVEINRTLRGAILDRNGNPIVYSDTRGGRRIYPDPLLAESLGQTVGYNSAIYGPSGLEYTFNDYLNGRGHNNILMEWFSRVRYILTREFNGQDLQTTIDPDLQKMVYNLMRDPARVHNAGAALLMDPQTGEILALVSVPTFDPALIDSLYPTLTDADQLLVNRVTQGFYAPGSVFKIFTAAAALDRPTYGPDGSLITQETMFYYANDLQAPPDPYGAGYTTWWHEGACAITQSPQGFGNFTFAQALAYSDNVAFAEVGQAMGPFRLRDYAERFGIGQSFEIGVDVLPSNLAYEPEYLNTPCGLAQTAFGQGQLYVTPLQIGLIGATIANEGELPYPQLVSQPRIAKRGWRVIEQETAQQVTEMMIAVTEDEYGSGYNARIESVQVAGKTGTAQTNGPPHAWFIGFAPADDPQYLAVVVLENQGEGSQWAAPLVRDILYNALRVGRE